MQHSLCFETLHMTSTWDCGAATIAVVSDSQGSYVTVDGQVYHLGREYDGQPSLLLRHRNALRDMRWLCQQGVFGWEQTMAA